MPFVPYTSSDILAMYTAHHYLDITTHSHCQAWSKHNSYIFDPQQTAPSSQVILVSSYSVTKILKTEAYKYGRQAVSLPCQEWIGRHPSSECVYTSSIMITGFNIFVVTIKLFTSEIPAAFSYCMWWHRKGAFWNCLCFRDILCILVLLLAPRPVNSESLSVLSVDCNSASFIHLCYLVIMLLSTPLTVA